MDDFHRGLWALIALVLVGTGIAGLLVGTGIIGPQWQAVMMPAQVAAEAQSPSRPTLVWLGMGGLVVLLLGLLLLRSTVPVRRTRGLASLRLAGTVTPPAERATSPSSAAPLCSTASSGTWSGLLA